MIGRVRHRSTFTELRRRGVRAGSGPLTVTYVDDVSTTGGPADAADRALARVAFAIPRRVGKAVVRNRVRRRLRAIFVEAGPDRAPAGAYLVAVRPGADALSYRELSEHVHRALVEIAKRNARRAPTRPRAATNASSPTDRIGSATP